MKLLCPGCQKTIERKGKGFALFFRNGRYSSYCSTAKKMVWLRALYFNGK